jgi:Uncharacterized conserved protein
MEIAKFSVNQQLIETILSWVKSDEIAIPEIQRPFVWDAIKVRDLIDSLYNGYPIGYLIAWHNPNINLKNGQVSEGKKILIDGQQRVVALSASILGNKVIDKDYKKINIKISFNPHTERFEVFNSAIAKDPEWIPDIAPIINGDINILEFVDDYLIKNENIDRNILFNKIFNLTQIIKKQVGFIDLSHDLDIETVTEIFIRINSKGVVLGQADFAMSKIAVDKKYDGTNLRKCIDYFCHLSIYPDFYNQLIEVDKDFIKTEYFQKLSWLKTENDDIYDPSYTDLLRVAFTTEFERGRLSDLVSLLSGRNFETRSYEEVIVENSFNLLKKGIFNFINETNFKKFVMIIKSAGFISPGLIRSQNALNFAYILYLKLRSLSYKPDDIEKFVRRWFVLSVLTGRYSASPEAQFDFDIKQISSKNFNDYLNSIESGELSEAFWSASLVQSLDTSVASSPYFNVYLATQVKLHDKGFLSRDISVSDLILHRGDVHHVFPRDYLKKYSIKSSQYNQIANYVYMQSEININIGNKSPDIYFKELKDQCETGSTIFGGITDLNMLYENLKMNCIPNEIFDMNIEHYDNFLALRRKLIAEKLKNYYFNL